jgi:hypothetical protein
VDEAAALIGIAVDTLYRNADDFPFTHRPRPRCVRFSEQGIAQYLKSKSASSDNAASMWRNQRYGHD